jgi:hypothetical protein
MWSFTIRPLHPRENSLSNYGHLDTTSLTHTGSRGIDRRIPKLCTTRKCEASRSERFIRVKLTSVSSEKVWRDRRPPYAGNGGISVSLVGTGLLQKTGHAEVTEIQSWGITNKNLQVKKDMVHPLRSSITAYRIHQLKFPNEYTIGWRSIIPYNYVDNTVWTSALKKEDSFSMLIVLTQNICLMSQTVVPKCLLLSHFNIPSTKQHEDDQINFNQSEGMLQAWQINAWNSLARNAERRGPLDVLHTNRRAILKLS